MLNDGQEIATPIVTGWPTLMTSDILMTDDAAKTLVQTLGDFRKDQTTSLALTD